MPELPEVETTVRGLRRKIVGKTIVDFWSDLPKEEHIRKETIKYLPYFKNFKKKIIGKKITDIERKAKNILIKLSNGEKILVHLKMTGHLLFGNYEKNNNTWIPKEDGPLKDPYNRFVHAVFSFDGGTNLAFCDARKFGTIALVSKDSSHSNTLSRLGPEPFDKKFTLSLFKEIIKKAGIKKIKPSLMNQELISGIGNIYSDEILWYAGVHPERSCITIKDKEFILLYKGMKDILKKGILFGGDSTSDYRNIDGLPGKFHYHHMAYRKKGEPCGRKGCNGVIIRKIIAGRSAHFCNKHQK